MSTTINSLTLAKKVYNVLTTNDFADSVTGVRDSRPECSGLGEFESDLLDWGTAYGIAVGLARTEEACESIDSVADRAFEAASELFSSREWGSFHVRPQRDELVEAVLRAWKRNGRRNIDIEDATAIEFDSAIVQLGNAIGWPSDDPVAVA